MNEKRKNIDLRRQFDKALEDLKDILSCYDKAHHFKVFMAYLGINGLFIGQDGIRGRLMIELNLSNKGV